MRNKFFIPVSIAIVSLAFAASVYALTPPRPQAGQDAKKAINEGISAFRQYKEVGVVDIQVPTVVEVPLEETYLERYDAAVMDTVNNELQPDLFQRETRVNELSLSATSLQSTRSAAVMVDGKSSTYTEFLLTEDEIGSAQITVTAKQPITSSALTIILDRHVALPTSFELRATTPEGPRIVVAKSVPTGTVLRFPETTADRWTITLMYAQPLRIAELRFDQKNAPVTRSHSVRFLAQPGQSYRVYFDADRPVEFPESEAGNLAIDADVLRIIDLPSLQNPRYVRADVDGDSVPDMLDNCVQTPNTGQEDVNNNKRGDVCEDFDKDGVANSIDNCPNHPNRSQADVDEDTIGDACDTEESRITERYQWVPWVGIGFAAVVLIVLFALTARSMGRGSKPNG